MEFQFRLKDVYGSNIVTSYLDSPAHSRLMQTVPISQRPPVLLAIYADALDCDQMLKSSANNKIHCTYIKVLNAQKFGTR
jgi:hypothetical protein